MFLRRALLVLGLLAGCRESEPAGKTAVPPGDPQPGIADEGAIAGAGSTLELTARDFAFDAPERVTAGVVTVVLHNRGQEPHHAWLVRLEDDTSVDAFFHALRTEGPLPPALRSVGGPGRAESGFASTSTIQLESGRYLIVCLMTSADGATHMSKGMIRHLEVVVQ